LARHFYASERMYFSVLAAFGAALIIEYEVHPIPRSVVFLFASGRYLLHAFYFKDPLHGCARSGARVGSIQGPYPNLTGEFDFVADLVAELVGGAGKLMNRPIFVCEGVFTQGGL